ncbi:MAG: pyridoxamine 5'-phosphate oxidase family protein [Pseudomonadota bacterium]
MSEWYTTLDGLWDRGWSLLAAGGAHRFVTLATLSGRGPEARLVVLRGADRETGRLEIYTDSLSTKVRELGADPRAALHHWTPSDDLQIRLTGAIEITTGAALQDIWDALPAPQRTSYGVKPAPGSAIASAEAYTRVPDFAQFARLTFQADEIDIVHLGRDLHRRAEYDRADGWQGAWRAP